MRRVPRCGHRVLPPRHQTLSRCPARAEQEPRAVVGSLPLPHPDLAHQQEDLVLLGSIVASG